jgi:FtsH-binding integral membrane protein
VEIVPTNFGLATTHFAMQSNDMETNQATENLQVIRTLMERSALYRRALAPIMTFVGAIGIAGGVLGCAAKIDTQNGFILFWSGIAAVGLIGSFLQVRRQALKDAEPFWSPPTRRVAQALFMPLFIGAAVTIITWRFPADSYIKPWGGICTIWMMLYGCALNAAGFFMNRGIKLLGWGIALCGCGLFAYRYAWVLEPNVLSDHRAMGWIFGGVQFAYGIYLYFTEKRGNES